VTTLTKHVEVEHRWPGLGWGIVAKVLNWVLTGLLVAASIANVVRTADNPVVGFVAILVMLAVPGGWLLVLRRRWERYGRVYVDEEGLTRITPKGRRRVIPLADVGPVHWHPAEGRTFTVVERLSGKRPWVLDTTEWPLDDSFWAAVGAHPGPAEPVDGGIVDIEDRYPRVRKIGLGEQGGPVNAWICGTVLWVIVTRLVMDSLGMIDLPS